MRSVRRTSPTISGGRSSGRSAKTGSMRSWSRNWTATDAQSPARKNDSQWTRCVSASDLCPISSWHNLQVRRFASSRIAGVGRLNWTKTVRRPCLALSTAGEVVSIAGAGSAMLEGRLAALGVAGRQGCVTQAELDREQAVAAGRRSSYQRFGAMLNTLFVPPQGLSAITTDGTPICRCEEVTAGDVRAAIRHGAW